MAPLVHEKEEAGAAAIIIHYKAPVATTSEDETIGEPIPVAMTEPEVEEKTIEDEENSSESPFYNPPITPKNNIFSKLSGGFKAVFTKIKRPQDLALNHARKVILTIVVIIIIVFVGSVYFAINKQQNEKLQAAYQAVYPPALSKYNQGESLLQLNQNLARDSFTQAQQILNDGKDSLPKNSTQEKQVLDLLSKVNAALASSSGIASVNAKEVSLSTSPYLLAETKNSALYFSEDDNHIYGLTSTQVFELNPDGSNKKSIITNSSDWQTPGGFAPYNGNLYILDKKQNQILKYVSSDSGFVQANYFSANAPDFSNAVSMTIDSSVYVLTSDGSISKFTKGASDTFNVSGLDTAFSNPSRIYTNLNDTNIYVLDNGNSRIVVLDKNGNYKSQYQASILKNAKDFEVLESAKKIYVLSGGKVYEIDL